MITKNRRTVRVAAVAALAAVAVAGCTAKHDYPKPWPTPSEIALQAPLPAGPPWVTAPWTGKLNENSEGDQYSGTPIPGVVIMEQRGTDSGNRCTMGTAVQTNTGQPGFLTAGHCNRTPDAPLWLFPTADVSGRDAKKLPAPYANVVNSGDGIDLELDAALDAAVVPLNSNQLGGASTEMAQRYHVAGVMTADAVKKLTRGTPVCFNGAVSGLRCGEVSEARAGGKLLMIGDSTETETFTQHGDSGAPVFLLDRQGRAVLIGLVSKGANGTLGYVTYLEPALIATGAKLILDPDVAPYGGGDYSKLVAKMALNR